MNNETENVHGDEQNTSLEENNQETGNKDLSENTQANNQDVQQNQTDDDTRQDHNGQDHNGQDDTRRDDTRRDDTVSKETDDEYVKHVQNWRALREKAERAERERDELLAKFGKNNETTQEKKNVSSQEENFSVDDDDLLEGKHLKKYQQLNEQRIAQLEARLIENQIKSNFPDFDDVVNKDTLGMLRDADPELAESLAANPNIYSKAVAAYKSIKRYGLAESTFKRDKAKVHSNTNKPRTVSSLAPQQNESPLSRANAFAQEFSDEEKEQEWKIMKEIMKNA